MSILTHFFFVATFMFMFLESLHTYSLVAYVVKKNGILNRLQNTLIGWGFALAITCANIDKIILIYFLLNTPFFDTNFLLAHKNGC